MIQIPLTPEEFQSKANQLAEQQGIAITGTEGTLEKMGFGNPFAQLTIIATLGLTVLLGSIFLAATAREWYQLIYHDDLTIKTNLFGTTFFSLVGLHATHVIVGLIMLSLALVFSMRGNLTSDHTERLEVLSLYWHFVDAVWVIVFVVVYVLGR